MSRASKLTLLGTSVFATATVIFVHYQQKAEKEVRLCSQPRITTKVPILTVSLSLSLNRPCTKA